MTLPDFLTRESTDEIRLTGHRIGLYHMVHYYNEGYSAEMLGGQFPDLPLALIHKLIAFYLENRDEVDAYVAACRAELNRQRNANPNRLPLASLRQPGKNPAYGGTVSHASIRPVPFAPVKGSAGIPARWQPPAPAAQAVQAFQILNSARVF